MRPQVKILTLRPESCPSAKSPAAEPSTTLHLQRQSSFSGKTSIGLWFVCPKFSSEILHSPPVKLDSGSQVVEPHFRCAAQMSFVGFPVSNLKSNLVELHLHQKSKADCFLMNHTRRCVTYSEPTTAGSSAVLWLVCNARFA